MKKLFVLLLACGCAWQPTDKHRYRVIYADGYDTANQQEIVYAVQDAMQGWMKDSNDFVTFTFRESETDLPTITVHGKTKSDIRSMFAVGGIASDTLGLTYQNGQSSDIYIPYDVDTATLNEVTLHEFGHAIGLHHTGPGTLMAANINLGVNQITCADVSQLCDNWEESGDKKDCEPMSMLPCQPSAPSIDPSLIECYLPKANLFQPCDSSNPFYVHLPDGNDIMCGFATCQIGQACSLDGQSGVCVAHQ